MHADSDADSEIGIWIGIERLGRPLSLFAMSTRVFAKRVKLKIRKSNCNGSYTIARPAREGGKGCWHCMRLTEAKS